jgi:hypothetical protein
MSAEFAIGADGKQGWVSGKAGSMQSNRQME